MLLILIHQTMNYLKEETQEDNGYFSVHFLQTPFSEFTKIMQNFVDKWINNKQNDYLKSEPLVHIGNDWKYFAQNDYNAIHKLSLHFVEFIDKQFIPLSLVIYSTKTFIVFVSYLTKTFIVLSKSKFLSVYITYI